MIGISFEMNYESQLFVDGAIESAKHENAFFTLKF